MHTIETTGLVTPDHQLVVQSAVPKDVRPGQHKVTLTIDTNSPPQNHRGAFFRPPFPIGLTSDQSTFRREDIYDDVDR